MRSRADGVLEHVPQTGDTTAPVVTPPADTTIQFANGGAGLAHNDPALQSWLAQASAVDETDGTVAVTNNLTAYADPLPAGTVTIQFSATDASGNTGTATANLTIQEAAAQGQFPTPGALFSDGFESGDLSTTNSEGFVWTDRAWTYIVTENPQCAASSPGTPTIIYDGAVVCDTSIPPSGGGNWRAYTGDNSLRFYYAAGQDISEQRFVTGAPHLELWVKLTLRIPTNYIHPSVNPSNRKLAAFWMDGYEANGDGPTIIWEFWDDGNNGSNLSFHYSVGGYTITGLHRQYTPFITYPDDQGKWIDLIFHMKAASARGANDGVIELWKRRDTESTYSKIHELYTADIAPPPGGPNGWAAGYLMGWANRNYDEDTEWLMDNVEFAATNLWGVI